MRKLLTFGMKLLTFGMMLLMAACGEHPATPADRIVTVEKAVAVQPIKPGDIPPLPSQLGSRPANAKDAADAALAGRCEAIAFVIRAWPLLPVSAGMLPAQAPVYPECSTKP